VVYTASALQGIYAYSAASGALLWSGSTQYGAETQPVIANGVLYIEDYSGTVYAYAPYAGTNLLPPRRMRPRPSSLHPDYALRPAN
jgi:outer membrane protein assembly factor BamB